MTTYSHVGNILFPRWEQHVLWQATLFIVFWRICNMAQHFREFSRFSKDLTSQMLKCLILCNLESKRRRKDLT